MAASYRVHTRAYTGPFDLLLALVTRQRLDIGSISVSEVAEQYLAEVERMGELDLDVASDFLLVASTLLDLKAASLVPDDPDERPAPEDGTDELRDLSPDEAREALLSRLMAYKQFRNAAAALAARMAAESLVLPRAVGPDPEFQRLMPDFLEGVSAADLARLCAGLAGRRQGFLLEAEHVAPKRRPIALTVAAVDRVTRLRQLVTFSELLGGDARPETVVATFLAVLELFKRGFVRMSQEEAFGEIEVSRVSGAPAFELDEEALTSAGEA